MLLLPQRRHLQAQFALKPSRRSSWRATPSKREFQTCPFIKRRVFWQRDGLFSRKSDEFRCRTAGTFPLTIPNPDTLADARFRHAGAHADDYPGSIAMRGNSWSDQWPTRPSFNVGGIDPRSAHLDTNFASRWYWICECSNSQYLACAPGLLIPRCFHCITLSRFAKTLLFTG